MDRDISPTIRNAKSIDVPRMVDLRREAEEWLAEQGIEQWTAKWISVGDEKLERAVRQRRAWVIEIDNEVVATVTLGGPDEDLWRVEDGPALYLYKLIVARRCAGYGIGALIVDWACDRAAFYGYPWLRLDVWPSNPRIQDYYRRLGFTYVRTMNVAGRDTGALFQRRAERITTALETSPPNDSERA